MTHFAGAKKETVCGKDYIALYTASLKMPFFLIPPKGKLKSFCLDSDVSD